MNQAFLTALKSKSQAVQATRQNKPVARISDPAVAAFVDPSGSLQKAGLVVTPAVTPAAPVYPQKGIVVDVIPGRNRIDVYFPYVPGEYERRNLKSAGWRYNPDRVCWYHFDGDQNRQYLNEVYELDIILRDAIVTAPAEVGTVDNPIETTAAEIPDQSDPENFARYKKQVSELLAELKIDSADLALLAVDCLHKVTFGRDA